jgi:glycerol-3-phosphate acyltransferase PlsY
MLKLILLTVVLSYLAGSVPFAYLLGKIKGLDLRRAGSGNVGATNAFRVLGPAAGIISLVLDSGKGLLAVTVLVGISLNLAGPPEFGQAGWLRILAGISVIAGHNWTVFLKFKGGKGVATSAGVFLGLAPGAVGLSVLVWLVTVALSGYVSLGSILAALALPLFIWLGDKEMGFTLFGLLAAVLVILRHRSNIKRLFRGEENKISWKKKA